MFALLFNEKLHLPYLYNGYDCILVLKLVGELPTTNNIESKYRYQVFCDLL